MEIKFYMHLYIYIYIIIYIKFIIIYIYIYNSKKAIIETKDEIKSKTATYNENKKNI